MESLNKTLRFVHKTQLNLRHVKKDEKLFTEFNHYKKCRRLWRRYSYIEPVLGKNEKVKINGN